MAETNEALMAMEVSEQEVELSPQEALARLKAGEKLENAIIRDLRLRGEFEHKINLVRCTLIDLKVRDALFKEEFNLSGCELKRGRFHNATFEAPMRLGGATLKRVSFENCSFNCGAAWEGLRVDDNVNLDRCTFSTKQFSLWDALLCDWINFRRCTFEERADLRNMHAEEGVNLTQCLFQKELLLRGTTVEKKLSFNESTFEGLVDLSKAKLRDFVYFDDIVQGPGQRFALANTLADRLQLLPAQVEGRLVSERKGDHATAMYEYGLLKGCYQVLHLYDEEDWAFYRFKVNQRKSIPLSWRKPWAYVGRGLDLLLLDYSCRYGTAPFRALTMAALFIIVFALAYAVGYEEFLRPSHLLGATPDGWLNRLAYGFVTSITSFTGGLTNDFTNAARGLVLCLLLIEALLGTVLWGLLIVAFGRKVIR